MKFKNVLICLFSAALAVSCILWPSLISGYQDKKMRGRVELDKVEDASEIRTDTLTIAEKLALIVEADNSMEEIAVTNQSYEWGSAEVEELKKVCINELKKLKEMGNYARRLRVQTVSIQSADQSLSLVIDDSSHKILSLDSVKGTGIKAVDAEKIIGIWDRYLGLRETNKIAVIKTSHFVRYKLPVPNPYDLFSIHSLDSSSFYTVEAYRQ